MTEQELVFTLALSTLSGGLILAIWMRIEAVLALRELNESREREVQVEGQPTEA